MATTAAVRTLLGATSIPTQMVDEMLAGVSAVWLMGEPAEALAGDLVLCHPPLGADEVRAVVRPTADPRAWRLTVVAHDRPGLLAALAGALADRQLSITEASATVLSGPGVALQRVTAMQSERSGMDKADWDAVGQRLQAVLGRREAVRPVFRPAPPVSVESQPQGSGRVMVTLRAPDRVGLMWAVAAWFEAHDCNVEAYRATSDGRMATDTFVVVGRCDGAALASAIGGVPVEPSRLPAPLVAVMDAGGHAAAAATAAVTAATAAAIAAATAGWAAAVRLLRPRRPPDPPPTDPHP